MSKLIKVLFILIAFSVGIAIKSKDLIGFQAKKAYIVYKAGYMSKDGRIIDSRIQDSTTSEAQSYMLYRAVLMDDKETFRLVYKWTNDNLKRKDNLYSWLWGKSTDNVWKILDFNTASDGDVFIAYSLFLAYEKWNIKEYKIDALNILSSIWQKETKDENGKRILMPGAKQIQGKEINLSYYANFMFRKFSIYDEKHNWLELVDSTFYLLNLAISKTKTGLPPDWCYYRNGTIELSQSKKSDFSYDAIRVFLNCYIDYKITKDKRNLEVLKHINFFIKQWQNDKNCYTNYQANGSLRDKNCFVGSEAVIFVVMEMFSPNTAKKIYTETILPYLNGDFYSRTDRNNYYASNLVWFALYFKQK